MVEVIPLVFKVAREDCTASLFQQTPARPMLGNPFDTPRHNGGYNKGMWSGLRQIFSRVFKARNSNQGNKVAASLNISGDQHSELKIPVTEPFGGSFLEYLEVSIPELKLTYFSIPRSGNTTVKLALAKLLGRSEADFLESDWPHATAALGVHNSALAPWNSYSENGPMPTAEVRESLDWLTFTVVRNPLNRLWSAWFLLILLEDPHLSAMGRPLHTNLNLRQCEPRDIIDAFTVFLNSHQLVELMQCDVHFVPQNELLRDAPKNKEVFYLENFSRFEERLLGHLENLIDLPLNLEKLNESILSLNDFDPIDRDISKVFYLYRDDYKEFGYQAQTVFSGNGRSQKEIKNLILTCDQVRERNRRILALWRRAV